jgi:aminoglycoside phosphotransferase (APT) family kinase protein
METWGIETTEIRIVADYVTAHSELFDAITTPRLAHGDLWLNNILVQRTDSEAAIVGIIDAGFAGWADPVADWTIMRMTVSPRSGSDSFWDAYGALESAADAQNRALVYQARSIGFSLLELQRMQYTNTSWLWSKLQETAQALEARRQL